MNFADRLAKERFIEVPAFNFDREAVANVILNRSFGESQTNDIIGYHVATHKEINKMIRHIRLPYVSHALFFDLPPMSRFPIHIDQVYSMKCDHFSLNIPVKNTEMTYMNWWVQDKPTPIGQIVNEYEITYQGNEVGGVRYIRSQSYKGEKYPSNITTSPAAPFQECTLTHSCTMDRPHLVKVDDWHNVDNNHPTLHSYFLAIRFDVKFDENKLMKHLGVEYT